MKPEMMDRWHTKSTYDFELPEELIATRPADERDASRLLYLPADANRASHHHFQDLVDLLRPDDILVVNNTKVIPARLFATKETGGRVEILLSRRTEGEHSAICLMRPARKIRPGMKLKLQSHSGKSAPQTVICTVEGEAPGEPGCFQVSFDKDPYAFALSAGEIPLPPYMNRPADERDDEDYQTVFADPARSEAAAAPTAGLHFTPAILEALADKGVKIIPVTLHVGPGTFLPVRTDDIREHRIHTEPYELSADAAAALNAAKAKGQRIVAVGTTSVRVLETVFAEHGTFQVGSGLTQIYITPGYRFQAIDALITNFHLPESSLIMLVTAFAGGQRVLDAYAAAIKERYRFFSYGDACLFERTEWNIEQGTEGESQ